MARNSCPTSVKNAGAQLVKARRMAADLVDQIQVAYAAVKATTPDMKAMGTKEMEYGAALHRLAEAAKCEGLIGEAHNFLRAGLARCDVSEPTDDDIVAILGGGGGGR